MMPLLILLWIFVYPLVLLLICFIGYAKTKGLIQKIFMLIGAPLDVYVNALHGSLFYWEKPTNWFLTQRTARLKSDSGFRGERARLMCRFLNWIMKGHCHD